jgi:hypothetical protein
MLQTPEKSAAAPLAARHNAKRKRTRKRFSE